MKQLFCVLPQYSTVLVELEDLFLFNPSVFLKTITAIHLLRNFIYELLTNKQYIHCPAFKLTNS